MSDTREQKIQDLFEKADELKKLTALRKEAGATTKAKYDRFFLKVAAAVAPAYELFQQLVKKGVFDNPDEGAAIMTHETNLGNEKCHLTVFFNTISKEYPKMEIEWGSARSRDIGKLQESPAYLKELVEVAGITKENIDSKMESMSNEIVDWLIEYAEANLDEKISSEDVKYQTIVKSTAAL